MFLILYLSLFKLLTSLVISVNLVVFLLHLLLLLPGHVELILHGFLHVHQTARVEEHVNSRKWYSGCLSLLPSCQTNCYRCCWVVSTLPVPPLAVAPTPGRPLSLRTSSTRPGLVGETVLGGAAGDDSWNKEGQLGDSTVLTYLTYCLPFTIASFFAHTVYP